MRSFAEQQLATVSDRIVVHRPPVAISARQTTLELCRGALAAPVDAPPLGELVGRVPPNKPVAVVISDATREEPRDALLEAIFEVVPRGRAVLVVASGTHRADASSVPGAFRDVPVVVHDGRDGDACVDLGSTAEGTPIRLSSTLVTAGLVVVAGRLRPHYFAGYSGGAKGIFPGCALAEDALQNHLMKADPTARLGRLHDNRCRLDMEAAARALPVPSFLLNVLANVEGQPVAAAAGDIVSAHRSLAEVARGCFEVRAPRSSVVIVADGPPVSSSLYQASKLLPPAGAILEPGGTVVAVADCDQGLGGDLSRVNDGIYRLGIVPQLPHHRVVFVSRLADAVAAVAYPRVVRELAPLLDELGGREPIPALWGASEMVVKTLHD